MNLVIVTAVVAATLMTLAILAVRARRWRFAIAAIGLMSLQALYVLTFGMSGLRAHTEQARSHGVSDDFVAGMVERDRFFLAPRIALGISILGLVVVSIGAIRKARIG